MASTALAIVQDVRDCRWSRQDLEKAWVCLREGKPRNIDEAECRTCSYWERPVAFLTADAIGRSATVARETWQLLAFSIRASLMLTAIFFAAVGFATLSEPSSVPFTVMLWLCAAAFAGLAAFWNPPAD